MTEEPDKLLTEIPNVFTLCDVLVENPSCCDQSRESMSSVLSKFLFRCLKSFDKTNKEHKEKHEWAMKDIRKLLLPLNVYTISQIGVNGTTVERIHLEQISRIVCQKTKELSERNIPERESELERIISSISYGNIGLAIPTNLYGESVHPLLKHLQGFLIARGPDADADAEGIA
uniref:Uncharacterized protein n=1 Tax=Magallana gigas TaxID=29159 RepID=K1RH29_MAGGI